MFVILQNLLSAHKLTLKKTPRSSRASRWRKGCIVLLLSIVTSTAFAATPSQDLATLLSGYKSLQANFTQTMTNEKGKLLQRSRGKMSLKRPGQFRWQITSPNKQLIIANNKYLWIYDVDLEQATQQKINKANTNSPAWLLSGSVTEIQDRFVVNRISGSGGGQWFELKPKAKGDLFEWVKMQFKNKKMQQMILDDNLGQLSTFKFTRIKVNPQLSNYLFQFRAPKGVDVIKQ